MSARCAYRYFELMREVPFKEALLCHAIRHYPSSRKCLGTVYEVSC